MKKEQIAVQMYSLHGDCAKDFPATLKVIADMGYRNIELAGFHGNDPKRVREITADLGLTVRSAHVGLVDLSEDFDGTMAKYATFGKPQIIIPWLRDEWIKDLTTAQKTAANIHALSEKIVAAGYECGFHNHWNEFLVRFEDGSCVWDMLFGNDTKTDKLFAQIDLAWCKRGGLDPATEMKRLGKSVRNLHIKDINEDGNGVVVSTGLLEWGGIMAQAQECGTSWYTIECEDTTDQRQKLVQLAYDNLAKLAS